MKLVLFEIPMTLPSASNLREHWSARHRRVKAQRQAVGLVLKSMHLLRPGLEEVVAQLTRGLDIEVTLTRIAPRKLDPNNLPAAFKSVMDSIAAHLGTDDRSEQYHWHYRQESGAPAIRIAIAKRYSIKPLDIESRIEREAAK